MENETREQTSASLPAIVQARASAGRLIGRFLIGFVGVFQIAIGLPMFYQLVLEVGLARRIIHPGVILYLVMMALGVGLLLRASRPCIWISLALYALFGLFIIHDAFFGEQKPPIPTMVVGVLLPLLLLVGTALLDVPTKQTGPASANGKKDIEGGREAVNQDEAH